MCGITGFLNRSDSGSRDKMGETVGRMVDPLFHRGPDDRGLWVDPEAGIALGHCRLSILDLSQAGHQPMISHCGRYVISYNGEIYNFDSIRKQLQDDLSKPAFEWRGHSDTEVMVAAISRWGLAEAVKRFNGMFAFALWDRKERVLSLVRDRIGKKPLYYGWMGKTFLFGSELKALRAHPCFQGEIDRDVLALFLRHNYIPSPFSIYKGFYKLQPGTMLSVSLDKADQMLNPTPYWTVREHAERGEKDTILHSREDIIASLDNLLRDAVKIRMVADVPLGVFLSGGVDSSVVAALMQAQSKGSVKTFTIGFDDESYNEAKDAKAVAFHLGTEHKELYVTPEEAREVIPRLPALYDEPFSDSSQIPTFLVSQMARNHVTVCLSGDGGDELFGGYTRYQWCRNIWQGIGWIPKRVRQALGRGLMVVSPSAWDILIKRLKPILPGRLFQRNPGYKISKLAEILAVDCPDMMYYMLVSHWKEPSSIVIGAKEPSTVLTDSQSWADIPNFTKRMMYLDLVTYLPDDILVKVDRASMGVSLETRAPLLDYRVIEFALSLPLSLKMHDGQSKWLLRQVLYRYVPKELIERPKMGFGIPIDSWLRGPLRDWAEALLDEKRLKREGFFNPTPINEKWVEHVYRGFNWQYYLWDILMFQAWLDENKSF